MRTPERSVTLKADGVVLRVDTVNRELTVLAGDHVLVLDVPPDSPITLRTERVKLRMVQPRDRVRVTYRQKRDGRIASAVEVRSGPGPS